LDDFPLMINSTAMDDWDSMINFAFQGDYTLSMNCL